MIGHYSFINFSFCEGKLAYTIPVYARYMYTTYFNYNAYDEGL